ncbi:MAG: AMP-binding protein [Chloroflexi bacterium]|nr:AMP-binding protein [Chloroflexota bacterium]
MTPSLFRESIPNYEKIPLQMFLERAAEEWPDKVAIIDGDRSVTYREILAQAQSFAIGLAGMGVVKGDRVALLAPNCAEYAPAFFGVLMTGAIVTTLNPSYREREVAHQLNDSGASILIGHSALEEVIALTKPLASGIRETISIGGALPGAKSFEDVIASASGALPEVEIDPDNDIAALPYSSGTTGLTKGVMLSHFNIGANVQQMNNRDEVASFQHDDVGILFLPLYHIYGMFFLIASMAAGSTTTVMARFNMEDFLGLIERDRVTILPMAPPVILGLASYPGLADRDLSSLRWAIVAAAPSSAELQQRGSEALGCLVIQGYGMTELSPVSHLDYAEDGMYEYGSVGTPFADTEVRVVDIEDGVTDLPFGEEGEMLVRGPQVMKGYYNNPAATAETITPDGWLHTGDIVRMNGDRRLWITDRKKELIKFKGFQVPPAELEGILLEHPDVADACVIGKPDDEAGEVPKAFVVAANDNANADDIIDFVKGKVANYKRISEVEFVDEIPKNPSGKILRRVLKDFELAKG